MLKELSNLKKGTEVINQYGELRTVIEVIDEKMIRTYEEPNDLYHFTKLFVKVK